MYACRAFFWIPWKVGSTIFENIVRMISGDPKTYGVFKVTNRFYYQIRVFLGLYLNCSQICFKNIGAFKKNGYLYLPSPCCARRHIGQGLASSTALYLWPSYRARSMSSPSLSFLTLQSFSRWSLDGPAFFCLLESISEIPWWCCLLVFLVHFQSIASCTS